MNERVLTVRQPWADLIMAGVKDVENRTWPVPSTVPQMLPWRLWVHAAREFADGWKRETLAPGAYASWHPRHGRTDWVPASRLGVLLGSVSVTGCHHADDCLWHDIRTGPSWPNGDPGWCSRWAEPNVFHWTLTDPVALPEPIPMRGQQGLWRLPEGVPA